MRTLITISILFFTGCLIAQSPNRLLDINLGAGITFSDDISSPNIYRAGINYRFSRIFTLSADFTKGEATRVFNTDKVSQGNLNLLYSPLGNNKKHDLKAGIGVSIMEITYTGPDRLIRGPNTQLPITEENFASFDGEVIGESSMTSERGRVNFIAAYSYSLSNRLVLGLQVQSQPSGGHQLKNALFFIAGIRM